jgi:hypothetical protein
MAIVASFKVDHMTTSKYETVLRRLEAAGAGAPPGRLYHVSYGSHDGLQVIDVYDNDESLMNFGKTLMPILQEMGITAKPDVHQAYKIIKG